MKAAAFILVVLLPAAAVAQAPPDPSKAARLHLGPVALSPVVGMTNVGWDTNIFNEEDSAHPKKDATATVSTKIPFWMHMGKGRLSAASRLDYAYFATYASERAFNTYNDARIDVPLLRLTPYVAGSFVDARERPGYEIDARARHKEGSLTTGAEVRTGAKSSVEFALWQTRTRFDGDEVYLGTSLRDSLNRTSGGGRAIGRYRLTPVTRLTLLAETQHDRFEFTPTRDSDSVRIMPGVEFGQFTLITGSARVGYRNFDAPQSGAPRFQGAVGNADLGYTLLGFLHLNVHGERDLGYSYEVAEPYYIQTGLGVVMTQEITSRWDGRIAASHYRLTYQQSGSPELTSDRKDNLRTLGGGVGYRLGRTMRLGLDVFQDERHSNRNGNYNTFRLGTSVTYGF